MTHQKSPAAVHVPMWLLVLVTLSGTLAMHIFVPALPVAGAALGQEAGRMQLTITVYVIGLAVGQLIYGPISDAIGRRPTLLAGLSIYLIASVLAFFAPTLELLLLARVMQALGGAAGLSLGRAIVRDVSTPERATRNLALLNLLTMIGPGLAPVIGSFMADQWGWRAIFGFLVVLAASILACTWRILRETVPDQRPVEFRRIAQDYRALLGNKAFIGFAIGGSCATTALYAYVAAAPYILHEQLGLPIWQVGPYMAVTVVGASVGTLLTRSLSGKLSIQHLLYSGTGVSVLASLSMVVVQWVGSLTVEWVAALTWLLAFGAGVASPAALSSALQVDTRLTGSAAGMYGFSQMAVGALNTFLVGFGSHPAMACAVVLLLSSGVGLGCFRWALITQNRMRCKGI